MLTKSPVIDQGEAGGGCGDEVDQTQCSDSFKRRPCGHRIGGVVKTLPVRESKGIVSL